MFDSIYKIFGIYWQMFAECNYASNSVSMCLESIVCSAPNTRCLRPWMSADENKNPRLRFFKAKLRKLRTFLVKSIDIGVILGNVFNMDYFISLPSLQLEGYSLAKLV